MKTITIGRIDCDIVIPDNNVSRRHATISLVNGQYVYHDMSKNGTSINGQIYQNDKVVVAPGTPIYLSNKVPLPWAQILMLLPQSPVVMGHHRTPNYDYETEVAQPQYVYREQQESIGAFCGVISFLIPLIGFILYFVWKDTAYYKAKQAANLAWAGFAVNFVLILLGSM